MKYYIVILFIILILPAAYKEYQKDKNKNILAKYINVLLSVLIFSIYFNIVKGEIRTYLYDYEVLNQAFQIDIGFDSPAFNKMIWMVFVFFSFIVAFLSVPIALRKERARLLLLKLIPVMWLLGSIQFYKYSIVKLELKSDNLFWYVLLIEGVLALSVFLLYRSGLMKKLFQFTVQETSE